MRPLTLGTAGHIDHGKTALVEALTGKNTDRLEEEHRRGISIELGYAELGLPGGRSLSVVDVPGHEALVRTMVAGASGIDLFLMVIAADEGVMPQTREHHTVLRSLGVEAGVVALSRCDLAEAGRRRMAAAQARELIDAPLVEVSARTGQGLEALRAALAAAAHRAEAGKPVPAWDEPAVLHVDRVFTLRGIGTVVTGTLWSGALQQGDRVEVLPRGLELRVRSIQVHDRPFDRVDSGRRVALNLAGPGRDRVASGDVVCSSGSGLRGTYRLDVRLGTPLQLGEAERRVLVHHGTRRATARLVPLGDEGFAQLRLESPLIARAGDRFVLRRLAPPGTLGGGIVIDPNPTRHGPGPAVERLRLIATGSPADLLALALEDQASAGSGVRLPTDQRRWVSHPLLGPARRRLQPRECLAAVRELLASGAALEHNGELVPAVAQAEPTEPPPAELDDRALRALDLIREDDAAPRSVAALAERLGCERELAVAALDALVGAGRAVRIKPGLYYETACLQELKARLLAAAAESGGEITLAKAKGLLGTSRKYAQALLEHLDSEHLTIRHGDRHLLRRAARAGAGR